MGNKKQEIKRVMCQALADEREEALNYFSKEQLEAELERREHKERKDDIKLRIEVLKEAISIMKKVRAHTLENGKFKNGYVEVRMNGHDIKYLMERCLKETLKKSEETLKKMGGVEDEI